MLTIVLKRFSTISGRVLFPIVHQLYVRTHARACMSLVNREREALLSVGQCVDRWVAEELPRQKQAKCLILIGEKSQGT